MEVAVGSGLENKRPLPVLTENKVSPFLPQHSLRVSGVGHRVECISLAVVFIFHIRNI